jgi:hypothetical protein
MQCTISGNLDDPIRSCHRPQLRSGSGGGAGSVAEAKLPRASRMVARTTWRDPQPKGMCVFVCIGSVHKCAHMYDRACSWDTRAYAHGHLNEQCFRVLVN